MNSEWEDLQRQLERLLNYPSGSFDPRGKFFEDRQRIQKALGFPNVLLQELMSPEQLLDRILAGFETAARRSQLLLPREMYKIKPSFTNGSRRY